MKYSKHLNQDPMRRWVYAVYIMVVLLIISAITQGARAETVESVIVKAAEREGLNPALVLAIAEVESGMNPKAVGSLGEVGLFQLRPEYHDVRQGNVRHNIEVAVRYLAVLKKQCAHYGDAFFVCYNYGPARPLKYPAKFPYYRKVMAALKRSKHESARFVAVAD
jgi:soluble lytic murein transglycosylase-like protein